MMMFTPLPQFLSYFCFACILFLTCCFGGTSGVLQPCRCRHIAIHRVRELLLCTHFRVEVQRKTPDKFKGHPLQTAINR
jgi:hypothetical protein